MMCLIHESRFLIRGAAMLALGAGCLLGGAGCQFSQQQKPDLVNADPIVTDPAMATRNWTKSEALYPNFSSTAGYCHATFEPLPQLNGPERAVAEEPIFIVNTLLIPGSLLTHFGYAQLEATSLYLPPTHTGNPPLDPKTPNDFSGGPGTGYCAAPGRPVNTYALPAEPR